MAKTFPLLAGSFFIWAALHGQEQDIRPLDSHEIYIDIGNNNTFNVFVTTSQPIEKAKFESNGYDGNFSLTRKPWKKQLILTGLAQACANLGQIVGAANKEEKQQGYLNLLSTVLQVSAELENTQPTQPTQAVQPTPAPAPSPSQPQTQTVSQTPTPTRSLEITDETEQMAQTLLSITEKLAEARAAHPEEVTRALTPLLDEVIKLSTLQEKLAWIKKLFTDKQLFSQFLHELFSFFYSVLCSYIPFLAKPEQPISQTTPQETPNPYTTTTQPDTQPSAAQ